MLRSAEGQCLMSVVGGFLFRQAKPHYIEYTPRRGNVRDLKVPMKPLCSAILLQDLFECACSLEK